MPQEQIDSALRISVGKFTTPAEIEEAAALLIQVVGQLAPLISQHGHSQLLVEGQDA
ncbi:hypothetical protein [Spirulina subsalsa]|uniref:hypothetical protein n=1 Tax=Spirulina subsalsa TaxID=54311 RepID=UPI0002ECA80A|nr:hypothetical protein [Spirulina subsalsa]